MACVMPSGAVVSACERSPAPLMRVLLTCSADDFAPPVQSEVFSHALPSASVTSSTVWRALVSISASEWKAEKSMPRNSAIPSRMLRGSTPECV